MGSKTRKGRVMIPPEDVKRMKTELRLLKLKLEVVYRAELLEEV